MTFYILKLQVSGTITVYIQPKKGISNTCISVKSTVTNSVPSIDLLATGIYCPI